MIFVCFCCSVLFCLDILCISKTNKWNVTLLFDLVISSCASIHGKLAATVFPFFKVNLTYILSITLQNSTQGSMSGGHPRIFKSSQEIRSICYLVLLSRTLNILLSQHFPFLSSIFLVRDWSERGLLGCSGWISWGLDHDPGTSLLLHWFINMILSMFSELRKINLPSTEFTRN